MAGLVRDALWDNALDLVNGDGFVEETDLTIIPWNRTTVADGQWLQDHAIGPLSARDVYLADEIQKNVDAIDSIKTTLADYGMVAGSTGSTGSTGAAVNLVNAGGVRTINYKAVGDNSESDWKEKPASIVPGSESEAGAPAFTLGYMTLGNVSQAVDGAALPTNGRSCIIQGNCAKGNANQLLMLPDGVYYRSLATTSPKTMSQYGLSYDSNNVSFAKLMTVPTGVGAGTYNIHIDTNNNITFTAAGGGGGAGITDVDTTWFNAANNKLTFKYDFQADKQYAITNNGFAAITTSEGGGVTYNFTENSLLTATADANNVQYVTMTLTGDYTSGTYGISKTIDDDGATKLEWTHLNIPVIDSDIIRPDGTDSTTLDLRYNADHFEAALTGQDDTASKQLQLKLVNDGGIGACADGLKIDVKGSSAFNTVKIDNVNALNIIEEQGRLINSFACVSAEGNNHADQLLVNPGFILSGFNLSASCSKDHGEEIITSGTLQAILNAFEERIHELETKITSTIDIDVIRPNS